MPVDPNLVFGWRETLLLTRVPSDSSSNSSHGDLGLSASSFTNSSEGSVLGLAPFYVSELESGGTRALGLLGLQVSRWSPVAALWGLKVAPT